MKSERTQLIQALILILIINGCIIGVAVWLSSWKIVSLKHEFTSSVDRLAELEGMQRAVGGVDTALKETEAFAGRTEKLFFTASKDSVTRVLETLEGLAIEEGLTIDISNATLEETGKRQSPAQLDIHLAGSFAGVMNTVSGIESGPFLARVESLDVSDGEKGVNATLTIALERP